MKFIRTILVGVFIGIFVGMWMGINLGSEQPLFSIPQLDKPATDS